MTVGESWEQRGPLQVYGPGGRPHQGAGTLAVTDKDDAAGPDGHGLSGRMGRLGGIDRAAPDHRVGRRRTRGLCRRTSGKQTRHGQSQRHLRQRLPRPCPSCHVIPPRSRRTKPPTVCSMAPKSDRPRPSGISIRTTSPDCRNGVRGAPWARVSTVRCSAMQA